MAIVAAFCGACLLLMGIYCIKMTKQSEYGGICLVIGVIVVIGALSYPILNIINAFRDEEIVNAVIGVIIYAIGLISSLFFIKSLWY